MMETYYGVIYFKNGETRETGGYSGPGAERLCEQETARLFERYQRTATGDFFRPTRYVIKTR